MYTVYTIRTYSLQFSTPLSMRHIVLTKIIWSAFHWRICCCFCFNFCQHRAGTPLFGTTNAPDLATLATHWLGQSAMPGCKRCLKVGSLGNFTSQPGAPGTGNKTRRETATWTITPLAGTFQIEDSKTSEPCRSHVIPHQPRLRLALGWGFSGDRLAWMLAKIAILGGHLDKLDGFPRLYEAHEVVPVLNRYGLSCVPLFQVSVQPLLDPLSCPVALLLASAVAAALQSAIALPPSPSRPGKSFLAETQRYNMIQL